MERVGVSGSHGFVGNRLSEQLERSGCEVDKLGRTGFVPDGLDCVFDLAAYGNLYSHDRNAATMIYKANLLRVMDMTLYPENKFVFVSTSSVTLPKQTYYSASKRAAEEFIEIQAREGLNAVIARPYTIIGPGEHKEHLIPKLIESCRTGKEMPFVSEPVHDFLDVDDFVDALIVLSENVEKNRGEVFPIGSGEQHTNQEVLDIVEQVTGSKANVKMVENMRPYDTKEWRADITKMYSLGWQPKISLEQSISRMVNER